MKICLKNSTDSLGLFCTCFNLNEHKLREHEWFLIFICNSLQYRWYAHSNKIQVISPCYMRCGMWSILDHSHYNLCVHILIYVYMPNHLVHHVPTTISSIHWYILHLVHLMCTFSITSSIMRNSVLPYRTQKHSSFSAGITAMQVHLFVLSRYLVHTSCVLFLSTAYWRLTLTCRHGYNIARAPAHVTTPLMRPICFLLERTPSIKGGAIDDSDTWGDVRSSLFHTRHHPWFVTPWVEVCLYNTSWVRRC